MDEVKATKTIFKIFGVVGLIAAVIAVILSTFNFIGMFAFVPSLLGMIFCFVSIFNLRKNAESSLFLIQKAGIVVGTIGLCLSGYQFYQYGHVVVLAGGLNSLVQEAVKEKIKEEAIRTIKEKIAPSSVESTIPEPENNSTELIPPPETTEDFFFISVDRLRIRKTPDLNGETLGHLDYGTRVVNLNEQSNHKDLIILGGRERNEPWRKISYSSNNFTKPMIGWIYGGGLVSPSDEVIEVNKNMYLKTISDVSLQDLSEMLGVELSGYPSTGIIAYKKSDNGALVKDGKFYLFGKGKKGTTEIYDLQPTVEFTGTYKDDLLHGIIERSSSFYETSESTKAKYENGKCVWYSNVINSEGEETRREEENPKDCPF